MNIWWAINDFLWKSYDKVSGYIKYSIVGVIGFAIHMLVLWLLTDYAQMWYLLSATIAIMVAALNNYVMNYHWTFRHRKQNIENKVVGYFKYLLSRGFTEGLYLILLYLMTDIVGLHYIISAIVVQFATAILGYLIAVKWIWKEKKLDNSKEKAAKIA